MSFLLYLAGLILIGTIAALVAAPLLRPSQYAGADTLQPELDSPFTPWERQKREAYAAIKEAEFDRQTGKLSEEDYTILRHKYEARALEALAKLDQLSQGETQQAPAGEERAPVDEEHTPVSEA